MPDPGGLYRRRLAHGRPHPCRALDIIPESICRFRSCNGRKTPLQRRCKGVARPFFVGIFTCHSRETCPRMFSSGSGNPVMACQSINHSPLEGESANQGRSLQIFRWGDRAVRLHTAEGMALLPDKGGISLRDVTNRDLPPVGHPRAHEFNLTGADTPLRQVNEVLTWEHLLFWRSPVGSSD